MLLRCKCLAVDSYVVGIFSENILTVHVVHMDLYVKGSLGLNNPVLNLRDALL